MFLAAEESQLSGSDAFGGRTMTEWFLCPGRPWTEQKTAVFFLYFAQF